LWVVAVATYVPQISFDYNFAVLPLALLCLVDRRDPKWLLCALIPLLLWWQPFYPRFADMPEVWTFSKYLFAFAKVAATLLCGVLIIRRLRETQTAAGA